MLREDAGGFFSVRISSDLDRESEMRFWIQGCFFFNFGPGWQLILFFQWARTVLIVERGIPPKERLRQQDLYSERMATGEKALVMKQTMTVSLWFFSVIFFCIVCFGCFWKPFLRNDTDGKWRVHLNRLSWKQAWSWCTLHETLRVKGYSFVHVHSLWFLSEKKSRAFCLFEQGVITQNCPSATFPSASSDAQRVKWDPLYVTIWELILGCNKPRQ